MEFENLQIEVPTQDDDSSSQYFGIKVYEKKYQNKSKDFVVGFNPKSKEFLERKARRAKRFGIKDDEQVVEEKDNSVTDRDFFKDIELEKLEWPPVPDEALEEMRRDAILIYGVQHMSTKDVFDYFKLFGPENLEWIDDFSCNVVWDDEKSVVRAMDEMSITYSMLKEIKNKKANATGSILPSNIADVIIKVEETEEAPLDENAIMVEDDDVDPKDVWRVGLPYKAYNLFFRPATIKDKKLPGAAKRSEYYLLYGKNPNTTQKGPGVLSKSRKRKLEQMKKLAEERFKTKEPDVKICDLAELKEEGIVQKMEVDADEPVVKRLNLHTEKTNPMTMIADQVELRQRVGHSFSGDRVHDRLGLALQQDDEEGSESEHLGSIHDRLGVSIHERLGRRGNISEGDARNDIQHLRYKERNSREINSDGYEDDDGVYHDIYRADFAKDEEDKEEQQQQGGNENEREREEYRRKTNKSSRTKYPSERNSRTFGKNYSSIKDRLGSARTQEASSTPDLRDKLRRKENVTSKKIKDIKQEDDEEKVNLCIEIKQEKPSYNDDIDMDDDGDFEF